MSAADDPRIGWIEPLSEWEFVEPSPAEVRAAIALGNVHGRTLASVRQRRVRSKDNGRLEMETEYIFYEAAP